MNKINELFFATLEQKILRSMFEEPEKQFYEKQIAIFSDVSIGGANLALDNLEKAGLVKKEIKGRMNFYRVNFGNPLVRQYTILSNLASTQILVEVLKLNSLKIILFGSVAEGTNLKDSDIDLFIVTNQTEAIEKAIEKQKGVKIQAVIKNPLEAEKMISENETLWQEIERGIVLYERKEENES
ncbi:MAG: Mn-dependent transcriptional regulator [Candidatus Berkelbacteria bacterium]|nr:Mn-dependent transcriptional regulator [Candidatus Berkelbacteria bacterium]